MLCLFFSRFLFFSALSFCIFISFYRVLLLLSFCHISYLFFCGARYFFSYFGLSGVSHTQKKIK